MKARKTYVISYYEGNEYKQGYFQNKRKALAFQRLLKGKGIRCNMSFWIDGAEMVRLAKHGMVYDSKTDSVKPSPHALPFYEEVMRMPEQRRSQMFVDYRHIKDSDEWASFLRGRKQGEEESI